MTTPQYKYIRGTEIFSSEHMLSATELARSYGLLTKNGKPNAPLVTQVIADYFTALGVIVDSYYYVHSHGVMQVYSIFYYGNALSSFVRALEEDKEYEYSPLNPDKRAIKYKYKKP